MVGNHGEMSLTNKIVRPINAQVGETVRIIWRDATGRTLEQNVTAPPFEVWKARAEYIREGSHVS